MVEPRDDSTAPRSGRARRAIGRKVALARFSARQVLQGQLQEASLRTGRLLARPTAIYVALTSRCDCRCAMCDMWRREPLPELPTAVWTDVLTELRRWLGPFHVNFNGGENYLREDFVEILRFCGRHDIFAGFVTNAQHVDAQRARETIAARPFNISLSLDGVLPETHDALRGIRGAHARVMETIEHMQRARRDLGVSSTIIIKPTVMKRNVGELPALARWVERQPGMALYLQPVIPFWSAGSRSQFAVDLELLDEVVDELVRAKREGVPILNSTAHLESLKPYFRDETLPQLERGVCHVGVKNMFIHPQGDVFLCEWDMGAIGNVTEASPREIWRSGVADEVRERIIRCRKPCLQTCIVKRSLRDNVDLFRHLVLR